MAKLSLSGQQKSIKTILNWYGDQKEAINDLRLKIISAILKLDSGTIVNEKFNGLDLPAINQYFDSSKNELEHLVCFDLISATEAFLRIDCNNRVFQKDKSEIGRTFRAIHKKKGNKMSLEEDIIEIWKSRTGDKSFSDFLGLLKYRHWLAHGRYWTPKIGRRYSFEIAYEISENILDLISNQK